MELKIKKSELAVIKMQFKNIQEKLVQPPLQSEPYYIVNLTLNQINELKQKLKQESFIVNELLEKLENLN